MQRIACGVAALLGAACLLGCGGGGDDLACATSVLASAGPSCTASSDVDGRKQCDGCGSPPTGELAR
jgi:hypothetical protein